MTDVVHPGASDKVLTRSRSWKAASSTVAAVTVLVRGHAIVPRRCCAPLQGVVASRQRELMLVRLLLRFVFRNGLARAATRPCSKQLTAAVCVLP